MMNVMEKKGLVKTGKNGPAIFGKKWEGGLKKKKKKKDTTYNEGKDSGVEKPCQGERTKGTIKGTKTHEKGGEKKVEKREGEGA